MTKRLTTYGIWIILAGLLAAGALWLRSQFGLEHASQFGAHTARDQSAVSRGENDPGNADSPAESEEIPFPRKLWKSAGIRITPVRRSPLTEAIELTGKIALNEDRLAHVFPLVEGRVDEVRVRLGQPVKQGDLLVVVQSKEVGQGMLKLFQDRLKLEFAEEKNRWIQEIGKNTLALIEMLRANAAVEEIELKFKDRTLGDYRERLMTSYVALLKAEVHMQRLSPLSQTGAVAGRQILEAETELKGARATLQALLEQTAQDVVQSLRLTEQSVRELQTSIAVAETNLKILGFDDRHLAEIDPARQGEQLAHYPVVAPFDGTVISKDVVLLERVGPERQILAIADLSTVWVIADIYETHLPLLAQLSDQVVRLRCDAWPDRRFEARIFYTGDVVQESTRTIALRATADNREGLLKPGMFVTVELPSLQSNEVLHVPLSAIQDHAGQAFVFVQTGEETFERRDVTLGRRNRDAVEIRSGVAVDEPVVVEGGFALKSKMLADLLAE